MSVLQTIRTMGIEVRLGPSGNVVLVGLDNLQGSEAETAFAYARDNKTTLKAELARVENPERRSQPGFSIKASKQPTPTMTESMVAEGMTWPPETQRVWGAVRQWFESRGYEFYTAGAMAFTVVQELIRRHKGPVVLIDDLPDEVTELTGAVQNVFPGSKLQWRPESIDNQPETALVENSQGNIRCSNCQYFLSTPNGDTANALGSCTSEPWDGQSAQWPQNQHHCRNFQLKTVH